MRSAATWIPPCPWWLCLATCWTYNVNHYRSTCCNPACKSQALPLQQIRSDRNVPQRMATKMERFLFLHSSQGMVWKVHVQRKKENWMSSATAEKHKIIIVLTLFCNIFIAALSYGDKLIDAMSCCWPWLFSVLLQVSSMTNWLLSHSRLNNNDANIHATARIIIVNVIFNYTEAANAAYH